MIRSDIDYEQLCMRVCETARRAGEFIAAERRGFTPDRVEKKGGKGDLVSYVDREAERMIVGELRGLLPGAAFITEEGTAERGEARYTWVIDPLDGTTNFVHGLPPYCVSIALMCGSRVVVGVVYEVTRGEMFHAWEGSGAWLDGRPIGASQVRDMQDALVAIGYSYSTTDMEGFLASVERYQRTTNGFRRLGSATADLVYVACGRLDAFAQVNLSPWDVAAGALIAERAGARVSDNAGGGDYVFGRQIVAAAPGVYDEFIKTVR